MDARYYSLQKIAASNKNLRVYVVTWDARPEAWLNDALRHPSCISTDINAEHRGRGVALWRKRERSTFEPSSLRLFFSFFSLPVLFLSFFYSFILSADCLQCRAVYPVETATSRLLRARPSLTRLQTSGHPPRRRDRQRRRGK